MKLIERLNADTIIYSNVLHILPSQSHFLTMQDVDTILKDYFSKKYSSSIMWYSSDRIKRKHPTEWKQIYKKLISERRHHTSLIYVDFSQCLQELKGFYTIRLTIQPSIHSQCNPSTGNILSQIILSLFHFF